MTDTQRRAFAWTRLQALSCAHAKQIGPVYGSFGKRRYVHVPEEIKENCEILGSGDEERIKNRSLWYLTYHPALFAAVLQQQPLGGGKG